jgi:hypothetical protein
VPTCAPELAMNVIDYKRNSSAEFSDLYLRLLNAALDEMNSSSHSPQQRQQDLAAHVVRGILMADNVSE